MDLNRWQLALTALAFILLAGLERMFPMRGAREGRWTRWSANLLLFGLGFGALYLASPLLLQAAGWLDRLIPLPPLASLGLPAWLLILVSLLVVDLLNYLAHVAFHVAPSLWRLHRTHHSDTVVDASTGVRHHPLETILNSTIQLAIFAVLGLPVLVVMGYALIAAVWQFVTHLDVRLPEVVDRPLRLLVVTPGMHRIHHSSQMAEGNSNFGTLLSIWDRLFGTYRQRPVDEHNDMVLGVTGFAAGQGAGGPLLEPFRTQR